MLIFRRCYSLALWFFISSILGLEITTNTIDRNTISLNVGDITIHSGAYWSIIDNAVAAFVSSITVETNAGLYISSTSPIIGLQVTLLGLSNSIVNNGVISFNALASLLPSTYNLIGSSFKNTGEMYLGGSGIALSEMSITATTWENSGLLVFYQSQRTTSELFLGTALLSITNNGQVCLYNQAYHQSTSIDGTGCWTAQVDSTIYIANAALAVSQDQTFYLADSASSIIVEALSSSHTYKVYGFGQQSDGVSNIIGLTLPLVGGLTTDAYSYNILTGVLTLRTTLLEQDFDIGYGYDFTKFRIVSDGLLPNILGNSVEYDGPCPRPGLPSQCIACKELPPIPGANPTSYTTTITTTDSDQHALTETGMVYIGPDSTGAWITNTTIFATPTEYTSTWTTTGSDGSVATESGIVSQSGTSLTTLSTIPPPVQTEYTTTWTTTGSDGSVATESGIVSQSGTSLTTLSTIPPPVQTEYTTTWTTTGSDGSVATESGIVSQSGTSLTTLSTIPPPVQTEYTTTWTTTGSDGSVATMSGVVSQSGTSLVTINTFPTSIADVYTTTWTTTGSDGSVATESGIVSQSGTSFKTATLSSSPSDSIAGGDLSPASVATNIVGSGTTTRESTQITGGEAVSPSGDVETPLANASQKDEESSSSVINSAVTDNVEGPLSKTIVGQITSVETASNTIAHTLVVSATESPTNNNQVTTTVVDIGKSTNMFLYTSTSTGYGTTLRQQQSESASPVASLTSYEGSCSSAKVSTFLASLFAIISIIV
ncbi:hypothetical protein KGF56_004007 [Candida oxycetoniae]|uniref:Hyphally-regulated cell wall protein N-terminal domain-containing protein n=1 Tax=Candida oxycetoniae TaxID=497107 RepID=A0AAI9SUU7_9ASCO|nr:uncharacterized protein KGF56_004007 [Candida oxycetoniae]KAI3403118.2 hypothetical protein KGF56_004007 [Candida oxycetoniae]